MSINLRALLLALGGGLLLVGAASAHAGYLRSMPGAGGLVSAPPARVDIWFTQELFRRQGENAIQVFGPDGQPAHAGEASVDDDDRTHLWVELLPGLAPGIYRVEWRSLSAEDGDHDEGVFSFTLDPQAQTTSTPMGAASPSAPTAQGPAASPSSTAIETSTPVATQAPTPSHTPPVAQSTPSAGGGSRCFSGSMLVAGLLGTAWVLGRRRPILP